MLLAKEEPAAPPKPRSGMGPRPPEGWSKARFIQLPAWPGEGWGPPLVLEKDAEDMVSDDGGAGGALK